MADRHWVGGTGNINDSAHWSASSGGAGGASVPTAADNAIFDANSGAPGGYTVTSNAVFNCLNLNFAAAPSGGGTITLAGSAAINCNGNFVALAGMVVGSTTTLAFVGAGVGKTITFNGVAWASFSMFGIGSSWVLQDDCILQVGRSISLNGGTFDTNGKTISCQTISSAGNSVRTLTLGASNITCSFSWLTDGTNLTLNAGTSTINVGGATGVIFNSQNVAFNNVIITTGVAGSIIGTFSAANLTLQSTASKTGTLTLSGGLTVTGIFKYLGDSAINRLLLWSTVPGTTRTITAAAIDAASDFTDFMDIAGAGAAAPFATGSSLGDCLGNSGITFTAPVAQAATGTASFTWSTHGWTTRVPLPQDDVTIANAFVAGRTITADMPRLGRNITCTCTGNPVLSLVTTSSFGDLVLSPGMTTLGSVLWTFRGRGVHSITTNAVTFQQGIVIDAPGGSYTLADAITTTNNFRVDRGTFNTANFNITAFGFRADAGVSWTINLGASTITLTAPSGNVWLTLFGTLNSGTSTIRFTDAGAITKTFVGGGFNYHNVWFNNAGSGSFDITGSNTFNQFKVDAGRSVRFTAGTITTAADWDFGLGVTIGSITAAGHTLVKSGGGQVIAENAVISRSTASPANTFLAPGGTDNGNNVNWNFAAVLEARAPTFDLDFTDSAVGFAVATRAPAFTLDLDAEAVGEAAFNFVDADAAFTLDFGFLPVAFPKPKQNVLKIPNKPDRLVVPEWTQ